MIFRVIGILFMLAALLGGVAALSGCDRQSTSASSPTGAVASDKEPVHVLATVYLLADIARQIGGDQVNAEWYVESGQSLNELVETPERRNQFRSADIVLTRGAAD